MKSKTKAILNLLLVAAVATFGFSCSSNEITQSASPVELIVSNTQILNVIDLEGDPPGDTELDCTKDVATISLQTRLKNPVEGQNQTFNDVKVTRYRVSYVRTDGGTLVPPPFVRSVDILLTPQSQSGGEFQLFQTDVFTQAPFAGFLLNGRDVETNRPFMRMDVIMDFFGETLAGSNVEGRTRMTLEFCANCGGCE